MASFTLAVAENGVHEKTLTASTVDTVTVNDPSDSPATIISVIGDGTAAIYFTTDGSTPTVGAQAAYMLPAGLASRRTVTLPATANGVVKLISSGAAKYSVEKVSAAADLTLAGGGGGGSTTVDTSALATSAKQDVLHADLGHLTDGTQQIIFAPPGGTTTVTQVASSATVVTLQASNNARRGLHIFNDSTAVLKVKFGSAASATSYTVQVAAGGYFELPIPFYRGIVTGIWASANGNAYVTEVA